VDIDLNALVNTYLRQYETQNDGDFWAFEGSDPILRSGDLRFVPKAAINAV